MQLNDKLLQMRDQDVATYLQQMRELAFEISAAMDAIAANALPRLQESVARQEMICATLAPLANTIGKRFDSSEPPLCSGTETAIELKFRAASKAIRELNLQYAALLKHSGRSIAVLIALYQSRTGQFQEARGSRLKHQTWSCEM
jgi:hypothetical protein